MGREITGRQFLLLFFEVLLTLRRSLERFVSKKERVG